MRHPSRYAPSDTAAVNTLIRSQDQVVGHRQLVELGFPERTIRNRTASGGPWQRILPRTYLAQTGPPSPRQLGRAALLYSAPDMESSAVLTGTAALELYGLRRLPRHKRVHVLVPPETQRATTGHVVIERTTRMPAQVVRTGLACAPFVRALVDAARDSTDIDEVRAMMAEAVQCRFCTPRQVLDEVRDGAVRHSQLARKVALEIADGVRSPAEGWLREAIIRFRVPPPSWNNALRDAATGRIIAVPDALWANRCVIAEVDSRDYHLSPEDWKQTQERHAMLTALGFAVLHFAPTRIKADPEAVCAEIMAALTVNTDRRWPRSVTITRTDDTPIPSRPSTG
jgi:hypothetical protein